MQRERRGAGVKEKRSNLFRCLTWELKKDHQCVYGEGGRLKKTVRALENLREGKAAVERAGLPHL